jgi:hypothetical protein
MVKVGTVGAPPASAETMTPPATAAAKSPTAKRTKQSTASASPQQIAPGGGPGLVWVNKDTKVYHKQGDRWYGATKHGQYMAEGDAVKAGYHDSKQSGGKP